MSWATAPTLADPAPLAPQNSSGAAFAEPTYSFDIPPQSLLTALDAFGERAKIQILYDSAVVRNRQSPGVVGEYSQKAALTALLAGTGLIASYQNAQNIILQFVPAVGGASLPTVNTPRTGATLSLDPLRVEGEAFAPYFFESYAQLVRSSIQHALLLKAPSCLKGRPIRIKVWVGRAGVILNSAIFASSGNSRVDSQVLQIVNGLPMNEAPPAGFPQPLHVLISAQSLF